MKRKRCHTSPTPSLLCRFHENPNGPDALHYFYEADRKTTATPRFSRKLRAHFAYIVRQRRHREKYGVSRIRAVLIETLDEPWREQLMQAARHPMVSGQRPSSLFWFVASTELLPQQSKTSILLPDPEAIFRRVWTSPVDIKPRSLLDR